MRINAQTKESIAYSAASSWIRSAREIKASGRTPAKWTVCADDCVWSATLQFMSEERADQMSGRVFSRLVKLATAKVWELI